MNQTALPISLSPLEFPVVERGPAESFLEDVISGLDRIPRRLPCKYFYDEVGSRLFERICELEEYYLTGAELEIMSRFAPDIAELLGPEVMLIEYGSGSGLKTRLLLDQLRDPVGYVPVDVSGEQLERTARTLASAFPSLDVLPVCADFTRLTELPTSMREPSRTAIYFPGSTIGNFSPAEARRLFRTMSKCCGPGGMAIVGVDLKKDAKKIEAAYNDEDGVTEQFNLNLLRRINFELEADFQIHHFHHEAKYNALLGRIEMYLISDRNQSVSIRGNRFEFAAGEKICTEHSHKYALVDFVEVATAGGFGLREFWTDKYNLFAVVQLEVPA